MTIKVFEKLPVGHWIVLFNLLKCCNMLIIDKVIVSRGEVNFPIRRLAQISQSRKDLQNKLADTSSAFKKKKPY